MSAGLIALLDDVAALAKMAAASLDDVAGQAAKAGTKAAGVVIDDAAVTPRYVTGLSPQRELPMIGRIALGSLRNKLLILLPLALALSVYAPQAITPLLMLGGLYLAYEGAEKVFELLFHPKADENATPGEAMDIEAFESEKVASAIRTDLVLSAEIMAITLQSVEGRDFMTQALVLAAVGIGITLAVYGTVALIVKADDLGVWLARSTADSPLGRLKRGLGRALVRAMPPLLSLLGIIGTAAMIWVGGGILIHGLEHYGYAQAAHVLEAAHAFGLQAPAPFGAFTGWMAEAGFAGILGLTTGFILLPLFHGLRALFGRLRGVRA